MKTKRTRGLFLMLLTLLFAVFAATAAVAADAPVEEAQTTAAFSEEESTTAVFAQPEETTAAPAEETTAAPSGDEETTEAETPEESKVPAEEPAKPAVTFKAGDVSGDGTVDAEDARIALRIAVGIETYAEDSPQMRAADLDETPGVTASDARLILRVAVGLTKISDGEDHTHVFDTRVVEPTCTSQGYTLRKCLFCDESEQFDFTPPAHRYEVVETTEATCTEPGVVVTACVFCGDSNTDVTPPLGHLFDVVHSAPEYRFNCVRCGAVNPLHQRTPFVNDFEQILMDVSHPLYYKTADELATTGSLLEYAYHRVGKWCCYYTIHDVFRPALKKAGYSEEKIDQIAPVYYTADKISKVLRNSIDLYVPAAFMSTAVPMYVPSMLADYYIGHPQYAKTYIFREFYDDIVEQKIYQPSENRGEYQPRVGDILFMSNKTSTYVNGYPTVDHTAQIIAMMDDGTFWCTEGSIIQQNDPEGDNKPRVRERLYFYNDETGAYEYRYNNIVVVLAVAQPDLYDEIHF